MKAGRAQKTLALLLITIIGCLTVWADEVAEAKKIVMTIMSSMDTEKSDTLEKILNESMHVALEIAGFHWTILPEEAASGTEIPRDTIDSPDWTALYSYGAKESADFILVAFYQLDNSNISIDFQLHDLAEREQTISLNAAGKVDLAFDKFVAEAIGEIIAKSGISASDDGQPDTGMLATAPEENGDDSSSPDDYPGDSNPAPAISGPAGDVREPGIRPVQEPALRERIHRLEISAGFAPFLTVGSASDYFRFGLLPSLYINYRIPVGSGYLAIGFFSGANYFRASGIIATSDSLLIPTGVDFRLAPIGGTRLNLFLRLSGGPAVLILNPNETGALTKVVPYVLGGIGINFAFGRWFGLTLDSSFSIFYEKSLPIMGYTPSVYLSIRI